MAYRVSYSLVRAGRKASNNNIHLCVGVVNALLDRNTSCLGKRMTRHTSTRLILKGDWINMACL